MVVIVCLILTRKWVNITFIRRQTVKQCLVSGDLTQTGIVSPAVLTFVHMHVHTPDDTQRPIEFKKVFLIAVSEMF